MDEQRYSGGFKRGFDPRRTGNGRPKVPRLKDGRSLAALARELTEDAVRYLHHVMLDDSEATDTRIHAARELLQLGWGTAPKLPMVSVSVGDCVSAMLTTDQLVALATGTAPPLDVPEIEGETAR